MNFVEQEESRIIVDSLRFLEEDKFSRVFDMVEYFGIFL